MDANTICGLAAVRALADRRPDDLLRLFFTPELRVAVGPICAMLAAARRPYRMVPPGELTTIAGTAHHGGVAAAANPRRVPPFDPARPPVVPLLLALDGIGNPHNLGAIARSAAFFGVRAMLIGEPGALPSDAAYRTAAGGLEYLELYRTRDLPACLSGIAGQYRRVAVVAAADAASFATLPRDRPIALVLGGEDHGVAPAVLEVCRRQVRIPGSGCIDALNVAQAAAVLLGGLAAL